MRIRALFAIALLVLAGAACGNGEKEAPPPPEISRQQLRAATLDASSVDDGWEPRKDPGPNTVQIGGRAGAANVRPFITEATTAFDQKEGPGFISNTILLMRSEEVARAVIPAHEEAALKTSWTQEREDGGQTVFSFDGAVGDLPPLGDAMFAARLKANITTADDQSSEHAVEYVTFSVGPMVAFVVTQDVGAGPYARRLESRVARLLS